MLELNKCYNFDCKVGLREVEDNSVDLIATDPPYAISFMGKAWDKALVSVEAWQECLRVLKPGAFAFIMSAPRQDVLSRMIINIEDAGFRTDFTSIYWAYASGFPKAMDIGKAVDKKLEGFPQGGENPNSSNHGKYKSGCSDDNIEGRGFGAGPGHYMEESGISTSNEIKSPEAKALDGSYGGFQPKPAVEVIIVAMKPLAEKSYTDQALANGHGLTWLDGARIPYKSVDDIANSKNNFKPGSDYNAHETIYELGFDKTNTIQNTQGRFPANLLVCDDVLNDGTMRKGGGGIVKPPSGRFSGLTYNGGVATEGDERPFSGYDDEGSASRYFDLDAWWDERIKSMDPAVLETFPFLLVPKASQGEKNAGLDNVEAQYMDGSRKVGSLGGTNPRNRGAQNPRKNFHPTVKPVKLFSYFLTLGSRPGDIVIDPFGGSGTMGVAAELLERNYILFEMQRDFHELACKRIEYQQEITRKENATPLSNIFKMKC